jgi:predicted alpha/beta superfamily hydrolase
MKRFSLTLLSLVVVPGLTARADDGRPDNRLTVKSAVLGEERVALVRTPPGYDTNGQRYPVLYLTDGDSHIGHTAATVEFLASGRNDRMPEMIVVGITNTDRTRDLTPTKASQDGKAPPAGGGADKFVKFIETELIPAVEKRYRTQPYRVFAGHSFGGLLAVHIFATRNDLFNAYIASSPSLWWDNQVTTRELEEFLKGHQDVPRTLVLTLGSNEQGNMRPGFDKAKAVLGSRHPAGFVWHSALMEDEDHGSVVLRSHYFGLRKIFDGWKPDPKVLAGGLAAVDEHFKALSARYKFTVPPPEQMVNNLAYGLLRSGKVDEAIAAFKANVERYPTSANVYDSLAEAYEKTGKPDLARPNYERAVQLGQKNGDLNLRAYRNNFERVSKALQGGKTAQK